MINAHEARSIILESVAPLGSVTIALDRSLGFALAQDITSGETIPPFDNAGMDGYAIRSSDIQNVPVDLRVVGEVAAGSVSTSAVHSGEAMSIMTGAAVPEGCDAVVQQEWTSRQNETVVTVQRTVSAGHNVRRVGSDIQKGETILHRGRPIRAQEIGVLASLGIQFVEVHRRPTVAILATGAELVDLGKPIAPGQIRNSNSHSLGALVRELRAESRILGIARDDRDDLRTRIAEGLKADALITSGGVSVGKYDLVSEVLTELGVEIKYSKVNIKPGMPFVFGMHGTRPVFGLPGNPVSTMVTFLEFVRPGLLRLGGEAEVDQLRIRAQVREEIRKTDRKRHFVRGVLELQNGHLMVWTTGSQVSNVLSSLTKANCLIVLPEDIEVVRVGEDVEVQML